ncbi:MAG: aminopeptidase P N-terminal domain-containing protein [Planctomycetes bacterium]|nr:aminopeptidase P N-terminal domain-containing protein [Planctomycetota bacterium]
MSMYRDHRERLLERLAESGTAALVFTATHKVRNHDCEYRFRPDSDFWYLTGFAEPESALVLLPRGVDATAKDGERDPHEVRTVLFLREKNPEMETWTGRRLGVDAAPEALGVDAAYPIEELWKRLPELLKNYRRVLYRAGLEEARDRGVLDALSTLRKRARGGVLPPVELVDPAPVLHELRLFKTPAELDKMRAAAAITGEAHRAAMAAAAPGVGEHEIDALVEYTFRRRGSTGMAYTTIAAGGNNGCILHYVENDAPLVDGELLLLDAGCEVDFYASDVTRTFPVNGTFTLEQRAIYDLVLEAEETAIDAVRPGATVDLVHETAQRVLVRGLVRLGLLDGDPDELYEAKAHQRFTIHKTSHWLGLDVHDCGAYSLDGEPRPLEPGMVLTVEPGLYITADDDEVDPRWRGIAVRIEDDVLVTASGHEVLTAGIPKTVDDVESACGRESLEPVA